ncbi:MAG: hypothetical protein EXS11_10635 [Gemmataceae bacterium]|nr:hypothetical protein [Gemmataceae bacterium]
MMSRETSEIVMVPLAEWTGLKAELGQVRLEFQNLQSKYDQVNSKHDKLLLKNSDLRKRLLDQSQDQHRQAGPFSRNKPKADPKPPGRKSGKKYGKHHCGTVPERIDEVLTAPLSDRCPSGQNGNIITEKVSPQYQVELPTKMVHRRFEVEHGCCGQCGKRLQGHHELQTSDALGVAGVTLGSRLQAGIALLNKEVGLPHGKIQRALQILLGHRLSRSASCRSMFRTAALGVAAFQEATQALAKAEVIHLDETGCAG